MTRSTTFYLVRHGQARAEDGSYDHRTPRSKLGHRQSTEVARVLAANGSIAAVYSSTYQRAEESAAPLAQLLRCHPFLEPRLCEFDLGTAPADAVEDRADLLVWHPEHRSDPSRESVAEFFTRVSAFFEFAGERHSGERIAVFSHAGTIEATIR